MLEPNDVVDYGPFINERMVACKKAVYITPEPEPAFELAPAPAPAPSGFGLDDLTVREAKELMEGMGRGALEAMRAEEKAGKDRSTLIAAIDEALGE